MFLNGTLHSLRVPPIFTDEERAKAGQLLLSQKSLDLALLSSLPVCVATSKTAYRLFMQYIQLQITVHVSVAITKRIRKSERLHSAYRSLLSILQRRCRSSQSVHAATS
jgi:hypothetical protein